MRATSLLDAGFVLFDDDAAKTNSYVQCIEEERTEQIRVKFKNPKYLRF